MLEKGQTPPNIRTDIMDEPPNPAAVPSSARMKPRAKPWERAGAPAASMPFPALASGGSGGNILSKPMSRAQPRVCETCGALPGLPSQLRKYILCKLVS